MADDILTLRLQDMAAAINLEIKRLDKRIDTVPSGGGGGVSDGDKGDIVVSGGGTVWNFDSAIVTTFGRTLTGAADAGAGRTALGLGTAATASYGSFAAASHTHIISEITGLQSALDGKLLASAASAFGLTMIDAADAAAARTTLGLGTASTSATGDFTPISHVGSGGLAHSDAVAGGADGFMTGDDKAKLDGIGSGATANSSDATLLARGNHTGTQLASTISDFLEASQNITMDETTPIAESDDFMNNSGGTGQIGVLGWKFTNGSIYVPALTQNHPGLIGLRTGATANQVASFYIGNAVATNILRFDEWLEARYIFRPTAANTDCAYQIGPMSAYGSLTPTHGVWLERLSTDTNWFFVSCNASTKTRTDSGVAFAAAWFNVKMRRISSTSVGFVLNGGSEVTITTDIPDAADGLNIGLQRAGTTTTTRDIDLDRIAYKSLAITR